MKRLLNVLYVLTEDSYLCRQGETVCVHVGGDERVRIPIHTIESIVCFGNTTVSTPLIAFCGERGVGLSFVNAFGRFSGRLEGPVRGNVLLRRAQYRMAESDEATSRLVYWLTMAKIANSRNTLLRAARESVDEKSRNGLSEAAEALSRIAKRLDTGQSVDSMRGLEGAAANTYFGAFDLMIKASKQDFYFHKRSRRPPLDNMNALMSFLYALLLNDVRSALESVGLDPAVGFLHQVRPGRPSLALDLMEELRSSVCDRLALALVNLRQLDANDFNSSPTGVLLSSDARKKVIAAWQKRKREEITHPYLGERVAVGLIPHLQAQLLARHLRGDIAEYPPFLWR